MMNLGRWFCMVLILAAWTARAFAEHPAQAGDPEEMFARAVQLQKSGDIDDAIREYEGFLKVRPDRVDARSNLGAAYAHLGRYEDAVAQYKQALVADPKNVTIRFNMALAYYKGAHYPESAVEFEQVVKAQPDNRNAIVLLADCDLRIGENKKVLDLLMPIEDKGQGDRLTAYMVGTALINDNRPDEGKRFIDRILRDGESAEAHALLGSAYLHAGDYQSAMEESKRAVDLNPNLEALHSLYGRALLFAGNPDQARIAFQSELKIDPNDFESNLYMGVLLKQDDKYDEALMYLQHAAQVRPGELLAKYYLGCTYLALGNAAKSEELLGQVVKVAPSFVEAHVALATAYYRLKQKDHGDSERAIIQKLNAEKQAKERGASDTLGPGYHGEVPQVKGPPAKPPGNPQQ